MVPTMAEVILRCAKAGATVSIRPYEEQIGKTLVGITIDGKEAKFVLTNETLKPDDFPTFISLGLRHHEYAARHAANKQLTTLPTKA